MTAIPSSSDTLTLKLNKTVWPYIIVGSPTFYTGYYQFTLSIYVPNKEINTSNPLNYPLYYWDSIPNYYNYAYSISSTPVESWSCTGYFQVIVKIPTSSGTGTNYTINIDNRVSYSSTVGTVTNKSCGVCLVSQNDSQYDKLESSDNNILPCVSLCSPVWAKATITDGEYSLSFDYTPSLTGLYNPTTFSTADPDTYTNGIQEFCHAISDDGKYLYRCSVEWSKPLVTSVSTMSGLTSDYYKINHNGAIYGGLSIFEFTSSSNTLDIVTSTTIKFNIIKITTGISGSNIPTFFLTNADIKHSSTPEYALGVSKTIVNNTWDIFSLYYKGISIDTSIVSTASSGDCYVVGSKISSFSTLGDLYLGDIIYKDETSWRYCGKFQPYINLFYLDWISVPSARGFTYNLNFDSIFLSYKGEINFSTTALPTSPTTGDWYTVKANNYGDLNKLSTNNIRPALGDIIVYYDSKWQIWQPGQLLRRDVIRRKSNYLCTSPRVNLTRDLGVTLEKGVELSISHEDNTAISTTKSMTGSDLSYAFCRFPVPTSTEISIFVWQFIAGRDWKLIEDLGDSSFTSFPEATYTQSGYLDLFSCRYADTYQYKYPHISSFISSATNSIYANGFFRESPWGLLDQNIDSKQLGNSWKNSKLIIDRKNSTDAVSVNGHYQAFKLGSMATRASGTFQYPSGEYTYADYNWSYIAVNGTTAYISSSLDNRITVLNLSTKTVLSYIEITNPTGVTLSLDNSYLYISQGSLGQITKLKLSDNSVEKIITSNLSCPHGLTTGSDGKIYIADYNGKGLMIYDPTVDTVTSHLATGRFYYLTDVKIDSSNNVYYLINPGMQSVTNSEVVKADSSGNQLAVNKSTCDYPSGLVKANLSGTYYVFVSNYLENGITILSDSLGDHSAATEYKLIHPCGMYATGDDLYICCSGYLAKLSISDLINNNESSVEVIPLAYTNGSKVSTTGGLTLDSIKNNSIVIKPENNALSYYGGSAYDGTYISDSNFLGVELTKHIYPSDLNLTTKYPLISDFEDLYAYIGVNTDGYKLYIQRLGPSDISVYETYSLPAQPYPGETVVGWYNHLGVTLVYPISREILRVYQSKNLKDWTLSCWSDNCGISWKNTTV